MNALETRVKLVTCEEHRPGTVYRALELMYFITDATFNHTFHGDYIELQKGNTFMLLALHRAVIHDEVRYRATCLTQEGLVGYRTADYNIPDMFQNWKRESKVEPIYIPEWKPNCE